MGEAKRRKAAGLGPRHSFRVRSAAMHEAAHVVADFHFDVPVLEVYVERQGSDASGFTENRWPPTTGLRYANQISQLAGPLADLMYRESQDAGEDEQEACVTSGYDDFRDIMGRDGISPEEAIRFGRACFLLYWGMESEVHIGDEKTAVITKTLVSDTTALATAYLAQIADLANAILAAPNMKMDEAALREWRDQNFRKVSVMLKGEYRGIDQ
jgi:hypothetical protein